MPSVRSPSTQTRRSTLACSHAEALDYLREHEVDLAVVDISLPEMLSEKGS